MKEENMVYFLLLSTGFCSQALKKPTVHSFSEEVIEVIIGILLCLTSSSDE